MRNTYSSCQQTVRTFGAAIYLCCALVSPTSAQAAGEALPLWELEGRENRIYLLGSVHMLRESDHPLPSQFYESYTAAEALIMELDITAIDPVATQSLVSELGLIKDGRQLVDLLGASDYSEALELAERINVPLALLASAEPWFAAITIDALMLMRLGFSPANGVEMRFAELAAADGKTITGLETERQQLEILDGLSALAQRDLLLQTLTEGEGIESAMDDLVDSWRRGDTQQLESGLLQDIKQYPEIYRTIVVQRNKDWVSRIVGLLDDNEDYLIIVGAMHLIGDDGVPALLRQRGLAVRQLQQED